jgi:hypothetical protein
MYLTSCPNCGQQLQPVALGPDSAPWACHTCRLSFWVAELSTAARAAWWPSVQSHDPAVRQATIGPALAAEISAAYARGTSALPEHLPVLPAATLATLAKIVGPGSVFGAQVAAAAKVKGGN